MSEDKEIKISKKKEVVYFEATGRRKTSTARVRFYDNIEGGITVNDKKLDDYFPTDELREIVHEPLKKVKINKYKITSKVSGGGIHSQAEAVRHGITRALIKFDPDFRKELKPEGLITRDPRMKERRKFGLKKARKAPQWRKR